MIEVGTQIKFVSYGVRHTGVVITPTPTGYRVSERLGGRKSSTFVREDEVVAVYDKSTREWKETQ